MAEIPDRPRQSGKRGRERPAAGIAIREMELEDLSVVFALGERLFTAEKWPNLYRTWAYGYLVWIGVSPDVKRAGVGTRPLNRMTELFIEAGARMMLVDTELENRGAINFFKKQGYGHEIAHLYISRNLSSHPEYIKRRARLHEKGYRIGAAGPTAASFPALDEARIIDDPLGSGEGPGDEPTSR